MWEILGKVGLLGKMIGGKFRVEILPVWGRALSPVHAAR
jgi:hypothetical protein